MANIFSEEAMKREASMELTRQEMKRKSLDTIRIYNPLERPFRYMYDGFWHRVDAKSTKDEPRYLAQHFFKNIANVLIGEQMIAKGEELKELREKQFGKSYLNKYEENVEVWNKTPRLDDPDLLIKVRDLVILGVVEEFGMELPDTPAGPSARPPDLRSVHDQIFASIDKRVSAEQSPIETDKIGSKYPINKTKSKLAEEVTAE